MNKLKDKKENIGIFDLETQYLFVDLEPKWNDLRWKEKKVKRIKLIPKMKIAIAGLLTFDLDNSKPVYTYYTDKQTEKLEKDMLKLDKIVGHNLHEFDYHVLSAYFSEENITLLQSKTIDTWELLKNETGEWMGLNDIAKLNFGLTKTVDTIKIPEMWREDKYLEVQEYLQRDLDISAELLFYGISQIPLEYYLKDYGKIIGKNSKIFNWDSLIE